MSQSQYQNQGQNPYHLQQPYQEPYQQTYQQNVQQYSDEKSLSATRDAGANPTTDTGSFPGGTYRLSDRGTDAPALIVTLDSNGTINSRPGRMMEAQGTVTLQAHMDFSFKKLFKSGLGGNNLFQNTYTGPGQLTLAPLLLGDIVTLQCDGSVPWSVSKHAYLAKTIEVKIESKSQGLGKALFSGTDLYVFSIIGVGLVWISTFGSVHKREIAPGEEHVVEHGHLVAWNCQFKLEKAGGSLMQAMKSGEGIFCRFIGPGTIYTQSRNVEHFARYMCEEGGANMN